MAGVSWRGIDSSVDVSFSQSDYEVKQLSIRNITTLQITSNHTSDAYDTDDQYGRGRVVLKISTAKI